MGVVSMLQRIKIRQSVGQFISNFVPGFYQVGRVAVLRELLGNLEEVYQGYEDFETVSEWKIWCIHCPPPKILDEEYEKYHRIFIREYGAAK